MSKLKNIWNIIVGNGVETTVLKKGERVKTKLGEGTVVGGSIHVKYDTWRQPNQLFNATHTHNLDEIKLL